MLMPRQWWIAATPIDLRCGMDRLLVAVRATLDRDAFDGGAFVFCNRARTRIKMLVVDATGVWLCVRRLHEGSFVWPRADATSCELDAEQFAWLCAGVDWQRLRAQKPVARCVSFATIHPWMQRNFPRSTMRMYCAESSPRN